MTSRSALTAANACGVLAFAWPFLPLLHGTAPARLVALAWAVALPLVIVAAAQTLLSRDRDIRQVTLIATLIALAVASRPLGAGVAGLEPVWAVVLLAGRALGPRAGFLVGTLGVATSALVTGGVGPWLPYQVMVAGWAGMLPGVLPAVRGHAETFLMGALGFVTGVASGALLNLWFWPQAVGLTANIAFDPFASPLVNVGHWLRYGVLTSLGFDLPRAVMTALLLLLGTQSVLPILRRATRRARLVATVVDAPATQ